MDASTRKYLAKIGSTGGRKSRRTLTPDDAKNMVRLREARKYFRDFHAQCFWSYDPSYKVSINDIPWVAQKLMTFGGHKGWQAGATLCP